MVQNNGFQSGVLASPGDARHHSSGCEQRTSGLQEIDLFITLLQLFSLAMDYRAIPCQFSGSGQVTLSNFPEILLKLSLPHMMNICKI